LHVTCVQFQSPWSCRFAAIEEAHSVLAWQREEQFLRQGLNFTAPELIGIFDVNPVLVMMGKNPSKDPVPVLEFRR
jgi:hypothetical protein